MKTSSALFAIVLTGAACAGLAAFAMNPAYFSAHLARFQPTFAAGGTTSAAGAATSASQASRPFVVRTINPQAAAAVSSITLLGRTAPVEQSAIAARATGYVAERLVDIGDRVKAGDVLLRIDAPEVEYQIARAEAVFQQAIARRELAEQTAERGQALVQSGALSKQTRDERRANERSAEADVAAARADVRRLQELQKFLVVRAPFDGTVIARLVDRGDRVSGGDTQGGSVLLRIGRLDTLRVQIDVPQGAAMSVGIDGPAKVTFAELPGQTFDAKVSRMSRSIDPESATMRTELLMANPEERIVAGLTGQVQLQLTRGPAAVTVPNNTLIVRGGRQTIAIVEQDGNVKFRSVIVGRDLGNRIELLGGLTVNDRVILSPNALIREGDSVEVQAATPAT